MRPDYTSGSNYSPDILRRDGSLSQDPHVPGRNLDICGAHCHSANIWLERVRTADQQSQLPSKLGVEGPELCCLHRNDGSGRLLPSTWQHHFLLYQDVYVRFKDLLNENITNVGLGGWLQKPSSWTHISNITTVLFHFLGT